MRTTNIVVNAPNGKRILGPMSLSFDKGEWVSVLGRNGSGKTTLCYALTGAVSVSEGTVEHNGPIGFLSQSPVRPAGLTTLEYTLLGCAEAWRGETRSQIDQARMALEACNVDASQDVGTLSGGEFRKAGIARLLTLDCDALILDEPAAGLDPQARIEMFELLEEVRGDRIVITVMHDLMTAAQFGERFVVIDEGAVIAEGSREEVMTESVLRRAYGPSVSVIRVDGQPVPITRR